jgi:hypothetical protein
VNGDPRLGDWRTGVHGLPVLVELFDRAFELGDRLARITEPAPFTARELERHNPADGGDEPWYEQPYQGGPMVAVDGFPGPHYPPDAAEQGKKPTPSSPAHVAYKRTVCRLGRWNPWDTQAWDEAYSNLFAHGRGTGMVGDSGIAGVQRQANISDTGWIGEQTFNLLRSVRVPHGSHQGEMAMDGPAVNLINEAVQQQQTPTGSVADVKAAITDYCLRCIRNEPDWHYSQNRAMTHLGAAPESEEWTDCSGHSTSAYYWARQQTGVAVPDPNHSGYNGYGYTGTLIDNPGCSSPYQVGDLAIYGDSSSDTEHVVTCYEPGDAGSAEWCSHGSEAAPYAVELHYRSDLLTVVRPGLLP